MTNFIDRIRYALAPAGLKAAALIPALAPWIRATFYPAEFSTLNDMAYRQNSAVFACVSALAFGIMEPPLKWYDSDREEILDHPSRALFVTPNDDVGEGDIWLRLMTYAAIGGQGYIYKIRNSQRKVIGLETFHIGNITPVPSRELIFEDGGISRILRYDYDDGTGKKHPVDRRDIIALRWPSVDMGQPWIAMPPLLPALREVATDNEAIRYLKAILQNDAVPRMVMYVPSDSDLDLDSEEKQNKLKAQWRAKYGGDNRGDLAIVTGGAKLERVSLNMEELMIDVISRVPESRISADLRVPAIVAGLNAGLENATYSNVGQAREYMTKNTLSPIWRLWASRIAADSDLNPNGDFVGFDMAKVEALQEDRDAKWARLTAALSAGGITVNDFLRGVGLPAVEGGDVRLIDSTKTIINIDQPKDQPIKEIFAYHITAGAVSRDEVRAGLGLPATGEDFPEPAETPPAKGVKESGDHAGTLVYLACPICGNVGVNVFEDHKNLAVCPACTCTFDPAVEIETISTNGKH